LLSDRISDAEQQGITLLYFTVSGSRYMAIFLRIGLISHFRCHTLMERRCPGNPCDSSIRAENISRAKPSEQMLSFSEDPLASQSALKRILHWQTMTHF
jgi:hypothetical protein